MQTLFINLMLILITNQSIITEKCSLINKEQVLLLDNLFLDKSKLISSKSSDVKWILDPEDESNSIKKIEKINEESLRISFEIKEKEEIKHLIKIEKCVYYQEGKEIELFTYYKNKFGFSVYNIDLFEQAKSILERLVFYKEIAEGIKELQDLGYYHGELAYFNIVTDLTFMNPLIDSFDHTVKFGKPCNTPKNGVYMAPELLGADKNLKIPATKKMDIFSLGKIIAFV